MSKDFIPNTEKLLLKITVTIWQSLAEKDPVNVNYKIAYNYSFATKVLALAGSVTSTMAESAAAVNLRVTGFQHQGDRDGMADFVHIKHRRKAEGGAGIFACFGVYDGHSGKEAAEYAQANLIKSISTSPKFRSQDDNQVLSAIREGFNRVHRVMYQERWQHWKSNEDGSPSAAGTTATICFIMRGKLYIANVGDSGIVLARKNPLALAEWQAIKLTKEHRLDNKVELARIQSAGGKVAIAFGTPRVVWSETTLDEKTGLMTNKETPWLKMSRSLGDFWSYNAESGKFIVSPEPEVSVYNLNLTTDQCIILASDGLWDFVSADLAVETVNSIEKEIAKPNGTWINPSQKLCQLALEQGMQLNITNDNITVITVMLSQVSAQTVNPRTNSGDYAQSLRLHDQQKTLVEVTEEAQWRIEI